MLIVISPAKTLDMLPGARKLRVTQPSFLADSQQLIDILRTQSAAQLSELMDVSDELATLNVARNHAWKTPFTAKNAKPALLAFRGDVYEGLDVDSMSNDDIDFAQRHLRILSGLYGVLKPLDLMQAYRLEMGTRLANPQGANLYQFWGDRVTHEVNAALTQARADVLLNLASSEYFKVLKPKQLSARIITPQFLDLKNGQYKMISFYAKRARGLLSSWVIRNRVSEPEQIKTFAGEGYRYDAGRSQSDDWVFVRDVPLRA